MREREEKVNPPREIPPTGEDYLSPRGWLAFSSRCSLPLSISLNLLPAVFSTFEPATEVHVSLKILYFIVTVRSSGFRARYCRSIFASLSKDSSLCKPQSKEKERRVR